MLWPQIVWRKNWLFGLIPAAYLMHLRKGSDATEPAVDRPSPPTKVEPLSALKKKDEGMNPESFLVDIRGGFALRLTGHGEIADFFKGRSAIGGDVSKEITPVLPPAPVQGRLQGPSANSKFLAFSVTLFALPSPS